jgi:hypothetical protein
MLHIFCNVSSVFRFFASDSDACFKCFIVFKRILQLLHLNVSRLDWVLHVPPRLLLPRLGVRWGSESRRRQSLLARAVPMCMHRRTTACNICNNSKWAHVQQQAWGSRRNR